MWIIISSNPLSYDTIKGVKRLVVCVISNLFIDCWLVLLEVWTNNTACDSDRKMPT